MTMRFRSHLKLRYATGVLLGGALVTPVHAGQVPPVPDFTGPWARNMFNYEPPDNGPGPIVNLRRLGADAGRSVVDGDPIPLVGDYMNPILKPEAAATVKRNGELSESGHDIPDPSDQCGIYSPPFIFAMSVGMRMLRAKDHIVIIYNQDHQVRYVRLNSGHPRKLTPTPMGDSVGHYEGGTLVIDTAGIKLEPYTVVDRFGTPQSDAMHVVERYRLIDAKEGQAALDRQAKIVGTTGPLVPDPHYDKALRLEVTVEDPKIFTAPWRANVTFRRVPAGDNEGICAENNADILQSGDVKYQPVATAPDF